MRDERNGYKMARAAKKTTKAAESKKATPVVETVAEVKEEAVAVEEVKEEKAPAKKTTAKKAAVKEEVVVEEVKEEVKKK